MKKKILSFVAAAMLAFSASVNAAGIGIGDGAFAAGGLSANGARTDVAYNPNSPISFRPNAQDAKGWTTLHHLAKSGEWKKVRDIIKKHGADPMRRTHKGETPLHIAAQYGKYKEKVMGVLLKTRGVRVDARNKQGRTPLHYAARANRYSNVRALLDAGADINARDKEGRTPLHLLSQAGWLYLSTTFLSYKADINARDKYGKTAMRLAAENRHIEIVKYFRSSGANDDFIRYGLGTDALASCGKRQPRRTRLYLCPNRRLEYPSKG